MNILSIQEIRTSYPDIANNLDAISHNYWQVKQKLSLDSQRLSKEAIEKIRNTLLKSIKSLEADREFISLQYKQLDESRVTHLVDTLTSTKGKLIVTILLIGSLSSLYFKFNGDAYIGFILNVLGLAGQYVLDIYEKYSEQKKQLLADIFKLINRKIKDGKSLEKTLRNLEASLDSEPMQNKDAIIQKYLESYTKHAARANKPKDPLVDNQHKDIEFYLRLISFFISTLPEDHSLKQKLQSVVESAKIIPNDKPEPLPQSFMKPLNFIDANDEREKGLQNSYNPYLSRSQDSLGMFKDKWDQFQKELQLRFAFDQELPSIYLSEYQKLESTGEIVKFENERVLQFS